MDGQIVDQLFNFRRSDIRRSNPFPFIDSFKRVRRLIREKRHLNVDNK
jgi:hypothetical protein